MSEVKVNKITPTTNCGTVTLGDSGDTISIPAGVTLDVQGTSSGVTAVTWDTTAKTAGFTAVAGNGYFVNTTSGAITVTLPATPSVGDFVGIKDYANTADTNNITIARNGSNIQGTANDFIISTEGLSIILIYVDATQGWVSTGSAQANNIVSPQYITATGGTVTCCGDYKIHTFTGPGTFTVSCAGNSFGSNLVDYLVVAGGGGGASFAGGGGGGGFRTSSGSASGCYATSPLGACVSALPVSVTGYPITVGAGGSGANCNPSGGGCGSNSVFSSITSTGGGGSSAYFTDGKPGGSGGGGGGIAVCYPFAGGTGNTPPVSPSQGSNGGNGYPCGASAGGGGGATEAGQNAPAFATSGRGGQGTTTSISGSSTAYAGGGGGASCNRTNNANSPIIGGAGSPCGTGGASGCESAGVAGTVNTGGGGGGSGGGPGFTGYNGAAGGSGIVIIRYKFQ
jgi:hypothetical protein